MAKTRVADFERARHELLAAFEAKGVAEGTTFVLETDEPAFLSLRPFDRYGELDAAAARQKAIDDAVGEATLKKLDDITHATLVPPHHNEIWSLQSSLSYVPPGGTLTLATATGGRMVVHQVMPEKDEAYGEASERSVRALSDGHAHVARLTYVSAYGSGRYVTLWLGARSEDADAPLPETAAAEEGRARAASEDETVHRFVVRKDLASK